MHEMDQSNLQDVVWTLVMHGDGLWRWWCLGVHLEHIIRDCRSRWCMRWTNQTCKMWYGLRWCMAMACGADGGSESIWNTHSSTSSRLGSRLWSELLMILLPEWSKPSSWAQQWWREAPLLTFYLVADGVYYYYIHVNLLEKKKQWSGVYECDVSYG